MYIKPIQPISTTINTNKDNNNFPLNSNTNKSYKKPINTKLCSHIHIMWIIPNVYGYCKECNKYIKK